MAQFNCAAVCPVSTERQILYVGHSYGLEILNFTATAMALLALLGAAIPVVHLYKNIAVPGAAWLLAICVVIAIYPLDVLLHLGEAGIRHRFSSVSLLPPLYILAMVSYLRIKPAGWNWIRPALFVCMLLGAMGPWLPGTWYLSFPAVQPYASFNHFLYSVEEGGWVMKVASYIMIGFGGFLVVQRLSDSRNSRSLLIALAVIPMAATIGDLVASLTGFSPYHGVTTVQVGTTLALYVLNYSLLRQSMLARVPVSRNLIISHMREGMCVITKAGEVVDCNEALGAIIGVSPNKLIGRIANRVLPESVLAQLDEYESNGSVETTELRLDNTDRTVTVSIKSLEEEQAGASLIVTITDVTEQSNELASVSAAASELQQKNERLLALTKTDPLTGLGNRRCLMDELTLYAEDDNDAKVGLLTVDIDHFKVINDTHGHAAGDAVLVRLATAMLETCRDNDLIVRWGGEEFVVLLHDSDAKRLQQAAERLRLQIRRLVINLENGVTLQVTASIGASMVRDGQSPESVLQQVDRLMLEAKSGVRDRVASDDGET